MKRSKTTLQGNLKPPQDSPLGGFLRHAFQPFSHLDLNRSQLAGENTPASDIAVSRWVKSTDPIRGFALCGADGVWKEAVAIVEGANIVLRAEGVANPTQFHYGYWNLTRITELEDGQRLNLYNSAGLPLSPIAPQTIGAYDPTVKPDADDDSSAEDAPAEPDPQWTNGAYVPSEWKALGENLLASAKASYSGSLSYICAKDLSKLTDGQVPVEISGSTAAGSQKDVVGFCEDSAAIWTFDEPVSIGKIRISTRWITTGFDAITVKDVSFLKGKEWVALGTPISHKTGLASITTGSLEATLADEGLGYLAQNVTGLMIVFGKPESAVANYYAEIEALAPETEPPVPPPQDPEDPPTDPEAPPAEPGIVWSLSDYTPSSWSPLANNILLGLTAQEVSNPSLLSFAASKDLAKLTDGVVSASAAATEIVGLRPGAELAWSFEEPMTVRQIRFSSLWNGKIYAGINIAGVYVQTKASSAWVSLNASVARSGNATTAGAQCALLSDPGTGYLVRDVTALKVVFGPVEAFANYYAEVEAAGEKTVVPPVSSDPRPVGLQFDGSSVRISVAEAQANFWYALEKTTDLTQPFAVDETTWVMGAELLSETKVLEMAIRPEEKSAFYRVIVSTTEPIAIR